jgi:hypothetical protein
MEKYNVANNVGFLGLPRYVPQSVADHWSDILAERIMANKELMSMFQRGRYNLH